MAPSSQYHSWPPDEPVGPTHVVGRLDALGYSPDSYVRLSGYTAVHALITTANAVIILRLESGREVARYVDMAQAWPAFEVLANRDNEGNDDT